LIAHGHTLDAIKGYTLAQVRAFMRAIERLNSERKIGEAVSARMAQADGKAFKDYIKRLERGSNGG
jgi:uncharacterized protein (UPF0335 family)